MTYIIRGDDGRVRYVGRRIEKIGDGVSYFETRGFAQDRAHLFGYLERIAKALEVISTKLVIEEVWEMGEEEKPE